MTTVAALAGLGSGATKRTSDDLLANMAGISNDQKKPRLDNLSTPSKVLHLRQVVEDAVDAEIIALGIPFGKVTNVLILKNKGQAFLEMENESKAIALMNYYAYRPPIVRGHEVIIQYSNHRELTTNERQHAPGTSHILAAAGSADVVAAASSALSGLSAGQLEAGAMTTSLPDASVPGCILRIVIERMLYNISLDTLHQVFSKYGTVLKIVTFVKNNQFQALVQYSQSSEALAGKIHLDGQNIYNGCCTLRIEFSKLSNLNIKYNNDRSRDYTRPELSTGELDSGLSLSGLGNSPGVLGSPAALLGLPLGLPLANLAMAGMGQKYQGGSPLVLVSNLNEEMISCDALFTLFGCYGDVQRVKILFNKKDTALVQFSNAQQAQTAIAHLNGVRVFDKDIKVTMSKHSSVSLPKEGEDNNLTKDYNNSPLHRFKKPGSKNFQNIFPPSKMLHLSNIPEGVTEEDLTSLFREAGEVIDFRFLPKDRKMAHLSMSSTEEAISALISMHNYKISETHHLRVSFARSSN
ncbi:polypyrimidine tract-binding protein 1 [Exaiptasia diaphana]|uniref:RRM domain-containing protein n=1 Tax=Exaiptasia diaphana TaxID=2652724 RepID=A0A913XWN3_EXADI|nr:polypyrimidine tract-binding protein 1 [Exaiptasia diaphana]KXJ24034.1 Polypyrimidine tract-binding protein 2 [Exaiptasia diaphana]